MVSNAVSQAFAREAEAEGVTVAEWALLRSLYQCDPTSPSDLARKMGLSKGAISKLADRLIAKRLIERAENPHDRRGHSLSLSQAGAQKVPILAALADKNDASFFAILSGVENRQLQKLLKTLIDGHGLRVMAID